MKTVDRKTFVAFLARLPEEIIGTPVETETMSAMQYKSPTGRLLAQSVYRREHKPEYQIED